MRFQSPSMLATLGGQTSGNTRSTDIESGRNQSPKQISQRFA